MFGKTKFQLGLVLGASICCIGSMVSPANALSVEFSQEGYTNGDTGVLSFFGGGTGEKAKLTGSFWGKDTNNDGVLEASELIFLLVNFSGTSGIPQFSYEFSPLDKEILEFRYSADLTNPKLQFSFRSSSVEVNIYSSDNALYPDSGSIQTRSSYPPYASSSREELKLKQVLDPDLGTELQQQPDLQDLDDQLPEDVVDEVQPDFGTDLL